MDKQELVKQAKEAYYNGEEIMSDLEFDNLEKELGLENKSYIGTVSNPSYTVEHPFIMGSLSKVQIHQDKNGNIDWTQYFKVITEKYVHNYPLIITPKYDGCSFELHYKNGEIFASTRGDGMKGKDISHVIMWLVPDSFIANVKNNHLECDEFVLRGEVLIKKSVFESKYSDFANPRSFVAGLLGRDYESSLDEMIQDLNAVIYYCSFKDPETDEWVEIDWSDINDDSDLFPGFYMFFMYNGFKVSELETVYKDFSDYREKCEFALDGIVIKPVAQFRENSLTDERPKDCVAVKFIPQILRTKIVDIEWNLGKTNEWFPKAILEPVMMDGKVIRKASLHNWNFVSTHKCGIGSVVEISLAGDIIPYVYKIVATGLDYVRNTDIQVYYNIPDNNQVVTEESGIGHLMIGHLSEKETAKNEFVASAETLNLTNIGPKTAAKIWDALTNEVSWQNGYLTNICQLFDTNIQNLLIQCLGNSKSTRNIIKTLEDAVHVLTFAQVIESCNFTDCGTRLSNAISEAFGQYKVNEVMPSESHFAGFSSKGWKWFYDKSSPEWLKLMNLAVFFTANGENIYSKHSFKNSDSENLIIKVILTGGPDGMTKKEWLKNHPEYEETTKWSECKILFCNDLNSTSSKMKKAQNLGIEIKLYN